MDSDNLHPLLKLRLLVGYLGEKAQFNWWPTSFFDGRLFLEPVFSKTLRLAQYHGVCAAARSVHDEHLSAGAFHLFRLPEELEQDLHQQAQVATLDNFIAVHLTSKESASSTLSSLAASPKASIEGPYSMGAIAEIDPGLAADRFASAYGHGLENGWQTYPYIQVA